MKFFVKLSLVFFLLTFYLHAERKKSNFSLVISGGVSLGAYEAGYNWALIRTLAKLKDESNPLVEPELRSIAGASAGSINALLSATYWCQKESVPLRNHVDDNLFYDTWVNLGIEDLVADNKDLENKSAIFTQKNLRKKGATIIEHLKKPIFKKNCEVPLGIAVTKVTPVIKNVGGINIQNQNFSVPLTFKEKNGQAIVENRVMPPSKDFYLSIPGIEKDKQKLVDLLLASGAFPAAFPQVKLDFKYEGKNYSSYFVDGGLYDNVPLDLAVALDSSASFYFFMNPGNMRKEIIENQENEEEHLPVGFITPNVTPLLKSFSIMQSMKLYQAINDNFGDDSTKTLILSSRYHPLAGNYLAHFSAFIDINFRIYDYYVGVYDAIYELANNYRGKDKQGWGRKTQIEAMNYLKTKLGIDDNPEALAAYNLLLNTEFHHVKPKTTDRFSAIYNAFNTNKPDEKRYDIPEFKKFLTKLDMKYLNVSKDSFIPYAKADIDNWYRRPLRKIIYRITTLENARDHTGETGTYATVASTAAWVGTDFVKDKRGFEFLPFNVPDDEGKEGLKTALRLLPSEIATDVKNGGLSFGYIARYYTENKDIINGFEGKASYIWSDDISDFVRFDLGVLKEYNNFMSFGLGGSYFGDMEGSFHKKDSAYGFNTYVDLMDIFRVTYVYRDGDSGNDNYIYFGIENIPSLIYWLNR